ncbi:hypothetical protein BD626DRAFT_498279 [Schizophyllum amplum]|uniref:SWIM-type domain-containing protein n=1 Tax=Schizophyllum amplum TaxID=97359 RepID=A0A550CDH0_9AGAR|nr:hypothetical protein BD626DRAFT_498279 [Auriculariopsis ampla]
MSRVHLCHFPYDALLERYMTSTAHYTRVLERISEHNGDMFEMRDAGDDYRCRVTIGRRPSCTCPDRFRPCMHLIHVFLHILGVPAECDVWYQTQLDDFTLENVLGHPIGDRATPAPRPRTAHDAFAPIPRDHELYSAPLHVPRFNGPRISSVGNGSSRNVNPLRLPSLDFSRAPWELDPGDRILQGPCSNIGSYGLGIRQLNINSSLADDFPTIPLDSPQSLLDHWSPSVLTPTGNDPDVSQDTLMDTYSVSQELLAAAEEALERELGGIKRPEKRTFEDEIREAERALDSLKGGSEQRQSAERATEVSEQIEQIMYRVVRAVDTPVARQNAILSILSMASETKGVKDVRVSFGDVLARLFCGLERDDDCNVKLFRRMVEVGQELGEEAVEFREHVDIIRCSYGLGT